MFGKLSLLFKVMQNGQQVADPKFWKQQQAFCIPVVAGVLLGGIQLAEAFGIKIPLDQETCTWIATLLYFAVNTIITLATSKHVGIPSIGKQPVAEIPQQCEEALPRIVETAAEVVRDAIVDEAQDLAADQLAKANEWLKRYGK